MEYRKLNNIIGWMVFIFATSVYVATLEPTVSLWDCGEYITTAYKLEVGHPPGAPMFMMLGQLFTMFTSAETAAYMINFMSALSSSATVLFLFWTITILARKTVQSPVVSIFKKEDEEALEASISKKPKAPTPLTEGQKWAILGSGLIGALVYTFSDSAWFSAVEGEVYAMSSFFTAIVIWAIFKWDDELGRIDYSPEGDPVHERNPDRWLVFIFFMIGLSIGVHLLNLLCIPAIAYVIYFRKYKVTTTIGFIITGVIGIATLGIVQAVLIPKSMELAAWFERTFTNSLHMPFNYGTCFYFLLILAIILFGLKWSKKHGKVVVNTAIWCFSMIMIGYSCFAMIVIRSSANTPLDENDPENLVTLVSYLQREQYGDWPIMYGQYHNSELEDRKNWGDMSDIYLRRFAVRDSKGKDVKGFKTEQEALEFAAKINGEVTQKYFKTYEGANEKPTYKASECTIFPRMYSSEGRHVQGYRTWSGHKGDRLPTMGENLTYFISYQVNWMYWRYFMWNFSGRQSDEQGHGSAAFGNWISGLNFIDKHHIGDQAKAPTLVTENEGNNKFYMLPLILGLMGFIFMLNKSTKGWWLVMLLFLLTGFAIIIYLNQKPIEPRERDYAYSASFYAFSIWIGMSILAMYDAYKTMVWRELGVILGALAGLGVIFAVSDLAAALSMFYIAFVIGAAWGLMILLRNNLKNEMQSAVLCTCLAFPVPMIMGYEGWDDHDRSGRFTGQALPYNYLLSCDKNSIIFTNGDNDTFPLWYLQEVENVGTDIRVCNLSLLNTDWYTEQMTRKAYDSDPLPIRFTEEQYRQHGHRDVVFVVGTNELTMREQKIDPKWKMILDKKIESNPVEFKQGFRTACTALVNHLKGTAVELQQPADLVAISKMDSTHTYYDFRDVIFNLLINGNEKFGMAEEKLIAIQKVILDFNDSFDYLPGDYAMAYLRDDANLQDRGDGRMLLFIPTRGLSVKVDKEKVLANGIVAEKDKDRIQDEIKWKISKQNIFKADLMILDIVSHFNWDRAVYFASSAEPDTYLGLDQYFYSEGLVYKLVPFAVKPGRNPNSLGEVNKDKMYDNMMNVFKWGNMEKPGVLVDYYTRRLTNNYRVQFAVLADAYTEEIDILKQKIAYLKQVEEKMDTTADPNQIIALPVGDVKIGEVSDEIKQAEKKIEEIKVKVNAVLDKSFEVMPHENVPYGRVMPSYVAAYYQVGNNEKAQQYTNEMWDLFVEEIDYYLSIDPEFSGQDEMIDEFFGAYRSVFSLYQAAQVYGTDTTFNTALDAKFREKTCEICSGLPAIRKGGPTGAKAKIKATFEAFFERIGWNCEIDCLMQQATAPGQLPPNIPGL